MLIRTQDKKGLINFNNVTDIFSFKNQKDVEIRSSVVDGECLRLGTYSTEEKALKVLDKIQEYYGRDYPYYVMPQEEEI